MASKFVLREGEDLVNFFACTRLMVREWFITQFTKRLTMHENEETSMLNIITNTFSVNYRKGLLELQA